VLDALLALARDERVHAWVRNLRTKASSSCWEPSHRIHNGDYETRIWRQEAL
jgi:hypothetical protein